MTSIELPPIRDLLSFAWTLKGVESAPLRNVQVKQEDVEK
jgi:hypothetical protein